MPSETCISSVFSRLSQYSRKPTTTSENADRIYTPAPPRLSNIEKLTPVFHADTRLKNGVTATTGCVSAKKPNTSALDA